MTKAEKKKLYAHPGWQWCTSEGSELHTLLLGLETTFLEKLEWLEEMEDLTIAMRAGRERSQKSRPRSKQATRRKRGRS
jgi:hypothetical protein